ncbi:MAG TPA: ABC transporter permease subunit [Anaerolineales bacterium]|nr:ABC transporter permease subunit [Anaerolineales bacterium]
MQIPWIQESRLSQIFTGRRGRHLREYLTAYLMLAPGLLLIFAFGIFPVGFALYVSLHKWLIVRDEFRGLANYVDIIDNLAYFGVFALGVGALIGAALLTRRVRRQSKIDRVNPWPLAVPAAFLAAAILAFLRWSFLQLPEFLDIAPKMRGLERTRELFMGLLREAFYAETVFPAWQQFVRLLLLAMVLGIVAGLWLRRRNNARYQADLTLGWLSAASGLGLLYLAFTAVGEAYAAAVETGEDPGIWPQLIVISSGVLLLILAWFAWRSAAGQPSNRHSAVRILAATVLMVGAVLLIIEIPTVVASGDPDLWNGLKVTVFFSAGTVPVQLTIALFLSVLLFQKVRGSSTFRVLYFLPYVTPSIASATIFRLMFSDREQSPANRGLALLGVEAQRWLREPGGILTMLANALGMAGYPETVLPAWLPTDLSTLLADWMGGPSQALTVVIMLSVWTFVGYNVVIYLAGLGNIPSEMTEAAEIDGANKWDVFRHVTFPLLSPTTYFLSLIAVMGTFKAFNILWLLRQSVGSGVGTLNTIGVVIFEEFFVKTRYGYASAMAFVLFAIILGLTFINNRVQGSRVFYG